MGLIIPPPVEIDEAVHLNNTGEFMEIEFYIGFTRCMTNRLEIIASLPDGRSSGKNGALVSHFFLFPP